MIVVAALVRALVYATLFIGFFLVFLPARMLDRSGIVAPPGTGPVEIVGIVVAALGALLAVSCILTFAIAGRGTPAPFDPPRRLVAIGPYRYVRNPMYIGAGFALLGAAIYYRSLVLVGYLVAFLVILALFVRWYEEPTLRRMFGKEYESYCANTPGWVPLRRRGAPPSMSGR